MLTGDLLQPSGIAAQCKHAGIVTRETEDDCPANIARSARNQSYSLSHDRTFISETRAGTLRANSVPSSYDFAIASGTRCRSVQRRKSRMVVPVQRASRL